MSDGRDRSQDALFGLIKTVGSHSAVYGLFDFVGKAGSLILVPLYAHLMPAGEFGALEIFTVTQALLLILLVLGFNSALVRFYTTAGAGERETYFRTALTAVTAVSAAAALVLLLLAPAVSRLSFGDASRAGQWRLVFAAVFFDAAGQMFLSLFRSQSKPFRYSWVNLARLLSVLVLNVILVGFLRRGVGGVLTGNLAGSVLGAALGLVLAGRESGLSISRPALRRLAGFGLPLIVSGVAMNFVMNNSNRYFLKAYATLDDLGVYGLAFKVGQVLSVLLNAFVVAWPPLMFRIHREEGATAIYARVMTYYLMVAGFVLVALASYSHEIVALISRPEYAAAADLVLLILLAYLLQGVYYILNVGVAVTDRTIWVPVVVGVSALVNLAGNFLLIPGFKLWGAAWSTLVSYACMALLMGAVSQRFYPIRFETARLARLTAAGGVALLVNLVLIRPATPLAPLLRLGGLLLFPALLLATGFFSAEERLRGRLLLARTFRRRADA